MKLLAVGLGNPGAQYADTRHNAGFWFINALAEKLCAAFSPKTNFFGDFAAAPTARLLRPATFMNCSGRAAAAAVRYFQIPPENILVAHDEADLSPGAVKLKFGGGDAGHNGLSDISKALGGQNYWRLRIGVGRGDAGADISDYVLARAPKAERELINGAIFRALDIWPQIANGEWQNAMLSLHTPPNTTDEKQWDSNAELSDSPMSANPRSLTR
ncbi:MAG: aminoacyl-tRNA hydrolase [Betaproteobacteria bacterium]|nr:aminoacyl-tRNA hydrolase [Betaproteobacteria bacterium]